MTKIFDYENLELYGTHFAIYISFDMYVQCMYVLNKSKKFCKPKQLCNSKVCFYCKLPDCNSLWYQMYAYVKYLSNIICTSSVSCYIYIHTCSIEMYITYQM